MKSIFISLIVIVTFNNMILAQISYHAQIGTGISQFYKIKLSEYNDENKMLPSLKNKIGLGLSYDYNNYDNDITMSFLIEQKTLKTKFIVSDSILWIDNDTSFYRYDDITSTHLHYAISIPVIFNKNFKRQTGIGVGFTNNFILNNQTKTEVSNFETFKYQLNIYLAFTYKPTDKIDLFLDLQNGISPFGVSGSAWQPYFLYNCSFSFGVNYNFRSKTTKKN